MTYAQIKLVTPTSIFPKRSSEGDAGLDVHADFYDEDGNLLPLRGSGNVAFDTEADGPVVILPPGERVLVPLGFAIATSLDIYTRVAPRSGLALKHGIDTLGGVVDASYRNTVGAIILNTDRHRPFRFAQGDRIAQIVFECVSLLDPVEVTSLPDTPRGAGGFGSTGR